ncbi:MAG: phosphotransferase [Microlunatus sp.]|nr:phosphotransferase [Microlunatus sp.]MDN5769729.1 phosphotransferase [Microlunatus sp.]
MTVRSIGRGLRILHDALPVDDCPFDWSVQHRVATWGRTGATELGAVAPPIEKLVVCHGDACSPNTVIAPNGTFAGHVDLGMLGLADRWADLAVATYSLEWNYEGDRAAEFYDAYGVERDHEREDFYRRLWDVT